MKKGGFEYAPKLVGMSYEDMKSFEDAVAQMYDNECVAYMGPERPIMQQAGKLLVDAIKEALLSEKSKFS